MLRVTVELVSAISPDRSRTLGVAEIANTGGSGDPHCSYDVRLSKWQPKLNETWKRGRVPRFNRVSFGAWDLLFLSLFAALGKSRVERLVKDAMEAGDA